MKTIVLALALLGGCATTRPATVRMAFDADRITSVEVNGLADRAARRAVTVDDPVRIASVSKLVVALGVMRLVEAGTLDLDRDVSRWLGWQLRHPGFPQTPITLRTLLSHQAGLRDGVDYAIPLGGTVRQTLAEAKAWDAHRPGSFFRYANLNFPVVASVMEAATGERFDHLMARTVFTPLALDACFNWTTCSDAAVARAVVLYDENDAVVRDDLRGVRPVCAVLAAGSCDLTAYQPGENGALFSPQGGLRISMGDLARIGRLFLGNGQGFLKPASLTAIASAAWTFDGSNGDSERGLFCSYGLAMQTLGTADHGCDDDLFGDRRPWIGHSGEAYGVRSGVWIDRASGRGVAFFTTAVPANAARGRSAFTRVEERLAR